VHRLAVVLDVGVNGRSVAAKFLQPRAGVSTPAQGVSVQPAAGAAACTPVRFRGQRASGDASQDGLAATAAPLASMDRGPEISLGPLDDREAVAKVVALLGPLSEWTLGMPQLGCGGQEAPKRGSQVGGTGSGLSEFDEVRPRDTAGRAVVFGDSEGSFLDTGPAQCALSPYLSDGANRLVVARRPPRLGVGQDAPRVTW
jgi:hypothetical protein